VYYSKDHDEFLRNRCLETNEGLSFELIMPKDEFNNDGDKDDKPIKSTLKESAIAKGQNIKSILIPDVVREKKVKFFREPRLGCYFILDMTYKSSFFKKV